MFCHTLFLGLLLRSKNSEWFLTRTITKRVINYKISKESTISKRKLISVKRKIPVSKNFIQTIEWKTAESVMKKLNWENKMMFGPLLYSSTCTNYTIKKCEESNEIIQHETLVPIIDPSTEQNISLKFTSEIVNSKKKCFNTLLSFPLVNKSVYPSLNLNTKISEWNCLRKELENISGHSSIPSVSTILEKTMPIERVEILERWKQNMILQLGEEGFQKYKKELFENGTSLHCSINSYLTATPESELLIQEENIGHWKSLKHVFPNITDIKLIEEYVNHPFLCYRGVVDCFARYKNQLVVVDWKTSKKSKTSIKSTYDNPLQIAAYVGALNFDPKYQYLASKGLIVIAYESGSPATVHYINENAMLEYWGKWLTRVNKYWEIKCSEIVTT